MQKQITLLLYFVLISFIIQAQKPEISYRVTNKDTIANCYDVYFKSSEDLNNVIVMDYTITIVAPEGWGKRITKYLSSRGQVAMDKPLGAFKNSSKMNDYLFFFSNEPFKVTAKKDEEVKLFSFCSDGDCSEPLRLIRGLSASSKNTFKNNVFDGADGPLIDAMPKEYDFANSITLFIDNDIYEAYFGTNYGSALTCPNVYQLQKATTKTFVNLKDDSKFSYIIKFINGKQNISSPILLTDTLQSGQRLESIIIPSGWTCTQSETTPQIVNCTNIAPIIAESISTFTLNVNAVETSILKNQAFVSIGKKNVGSNTVEITTKAITNCQETNLISSPTNEILYNSTSTRPLIEQANTILISNVPTIIDNKNVNYRAGNSVVLSPGFSINIQPAQGSFIIEISGCK